MFDRWPIRPAGLTRRTMFALLGVEVQVIGLDFETACSRWQHLNDRRRLVDELKRLESLDAKAKAATP